MKIKPFLKILYCENLEPYGIYRVIVKTICTNIPYSGKVWLVESLANLANHLQFTKLKPSKLVATISNRLADLFICQTIFCQMLEKNKFTKHSPCQTFPLYGNWM